jgi:four helix bundle protein
MPNFRTLKVWQQAKRLAVACAKAAKRFPAHDCEVLKKQLLRACYSVPLNIAEGSGRKGSREFRRYLDTARGSLAETQTALELAKEQGFIEPTDYEELAVMANETASMLWGLLRKISDRTRPPLAP